MKVKKILSSFIAVLAGPVLLTYCGTAGNPSTTSGAGTSTGVGISGTVTVPSTTSASISVGASLSKGGVGKRIITSKAIGDVAATTGTVTCKKLDGTVLDTGIIGSDGSLSGLVVSPSSLDSTSQVLLEATVGSKKVTSLVDLTGKAAGQTASAGTVNTDSTLAVQQVYFQASASATPDSPSALAAKIASGEIDPLALFKTFKSSFDVTTTAGSSDAAGAMQAISKAFRAAMANGAPSFADINSALQGGSIVNTWKGLDSTLSGVDMSTAMQQIQSFIPACAKTFQDSTTATKYKTAGDTGWAAAAQYFAKQTKDDLANGITHPEVFQGYLAQNATAFNNGDPTAFDAMKKTGAARIMGQFAGKLGSGDTFSSSQWEALKKLMDAQKDSFDSVASSKYAAMGEAFYNQLKAANSATEIAALKANPGAFAGKIFDRPEAYTGTAGQTAFDNQFVTYVQNPTSFTGATGCSSNSDCPTGQSCNTNGMFCISSTCSSNCVFGSPCTTNGQCASGVCTSGFCSYNTTVSGVDPLAQCATLNATCTNNTQCCSGICSSGVCASLVNAGSASFAGFYKKNAGATCVFSLNVDGISGTAFAAFGANDPTNPATNTVFGGGCTFSGTSTPFSIGSCTVGNPAGASGTIRCDGSGGSTTLGLSGSTLTGTCALGGGLSGTCTVNHTKL
ncbi:MAG: hypothetical protein HY877_03355 [Deltaproteobacteria bacterium]|nr:hypothetical protein [Deltaproteobacteria bacterium]